MVGLLAGLEHTQHQGRKEHCPVTCLGRGRHQFSFDPVNLTHHPQGAGAEIQVIPLECQNLAPAQAGGQLQQQKLMAAVLFGLDQQPLDFLGSKHFHFSGFGGWKLAAVRRVAKY